MGNFFSSNWWCRPSRKPVRGHVLLDFTNRVRGDMEEGHSLIVSRKRGVCSTPVLGCWH